MDNDYKRMNELTAELMKASDMYYNTGYEIMSNYEYDQKKDELEQLEKKYGITDGFSSKVGFMPKSDGQKVVHEHEAKSLDKTKDINTLLKFQKHPEHHRVCLSWKLDGGTLCATYENGKLVLASTRGNGEIGENVTTKAPYIAGLPLTIPFKEKLEVRGEVTLSYSEFDRLNVNGEYANPRNLVNPTLQTDDIAVLSDRNMEFHAFKLVYSTDKKKLSELPTFSGRLDYLESLGFSVVEHISLDVSEVPQKIAEWSEADRILALDIPVDGLVICNEDVEYAESLKSDSEHHPNQTEGMAFKWQDETAQTILRDIKWQNGRTGVISPVANFDTVQLEGTEVSKATLHNISYIINKDLRIGDRITVYKANKIIPKVEENLDKNLNNRVIADIMTTYHIPDKCPCCQAKTTIQKSKDNILTLECENKECPAKHLQRYTYMFSKDGINIEGLSEKTLDYLLSNGFMKKAEDIFTLKEHKEELLKGDFFGEKSLANLLDAIERAKTTDFRHFMYSQGIDGFGKGQVKVLNEFLTNEIRAKGLKDMTVPEYFEELCTQGQTIPFDSKLKPLDWTRIDGIGKVLSANLNKWMLNEYTKHGSECDGLLNYLQFTDSPVAEQQKTVANQISGKTFCITGSLVTFENRDKAFEWITANGGKTSTSVSSATSYLVNNDITSNSSKNMKAKALNIPIITEQQLLAMAEPIEVKDNKDEVQLEKD